MRYEHIEMDLSTHALDIIRAQLQPRLGDPSVPLPVANELVNLDNVIRARLQHTNQDPQAKLPKLPIISEGPYCSVDCKSFHVSSNEDLVA